MGCAVSVDIDNSDWMSVRLSDEQKIFLMEKIRDHPLFILMDDVALREELVSVLDRKVYCKDQHLFQNKFDSIKYLYFIYSGSFQINLIKADCLVLQEAPMNKLHKFNDKFEERTGEEGSVIGEMTDVYSPTYNLRCVSEFSEVFRLSKSDYNNIRACSARRQDSLSYAALIKSPIFKDLPHETIKKIQGICQLKAIREGEMITQKNEVGSFFFFVETSGDKYDMSVTDTDYDENLKSFKVQTPMSPGIQGYRCYGQEILLGNPYEATVIANRSTKAIVFDKNKLGPTLADRDLSEIVLKNMIYQGNDKAQLRSKSDDSSDYSDDDIVPLRETIGPGMLGSTSDDNHRFVIDMGQLMHRSWGVGSNYNRESWMSFQRKKSVGSGIEQDASLSWICSE